MSPPTATARGLLAVWEEAESAGGNGARALALLRGAAPALSRAAREALTVGRRDALLLDWRERLFGAQFTGVTTCPQCADPVEVTFADAEVRAATACDGELEVVVEDYELQMRLPTAGDVVAIEMLPDVDAMRQALVERCVMRAALHGEDMPVARIPASIIGHAVARLAAVDPQADVTLDLTCPACAHRWREPFDVVSFLWIELAAWARRLLGEVHTIASAYGWSERHILQMSSARRNAYLEMLR